MVSLILLRLTRESGVLLQRGLFVIADKPRVGFNKALVEDATWKRLVVVVLNSLDVHRGDSSLFRDFADRYTPFLAGGSQFFT